MQKLRLSVPLERAEARALIEMAGAECREPRQQLRYLLRREARRRGLLTTLQVSPNKGGPNDGEE
jgi:hypothetical protein